MKKGLFVLFVALLIFSSATFASGNKEKTADGEVTVSLLYSDNASYPLKNDWLVLQKIKEATGVHLDITSVPSSDYKTKKQIVFNSGKIPDMSRSVNLALDNEDALNGLLLPVSDYLDKMPNLSAFLQKYDYKSTIQNRTLADGKWYTLPVKADTRKVKTHSWMVRKDIFEKNNIPLPTTLDEVYQAGLQLKKLYPDSYPIINRFGMGNIMSLIGNGFDTSAGWSLPDNGFAYDEKTDSFIFAPTSDNYKQLLMYMHTLYESGVLDPEFNSLDSSAYEQRVIQGKTFILVDWVGNQVRYNATGQMTDPDFDVEPIFPVLGVNNKYAIEKGGLYEQGCVLSADLAQDPQFEQKLKFIDWFYSDEGAFATTFGEEGVSCYQKNGHYYFKDMDSVDPSRAYGLLNNTLCMRIDTDYFRAVNGDEIADLFDKITEAHCILPSDPNVAYESNELDEMKILTPEISDNYNVWVSDFIYGKKSFDQWDEFKQTCKDKGVDTLGSLINKAWKRTESQR